MGTLARMTDDARPGGGGRPDTGEPGSAGPAGYLDAPTVRARVQLRPPAVPVTGTAFTPFAQPAPIAVPPPAYPGAPAAPTGLPAAPTGPPAAPAGPPAGPPAAYRVPGPPVAGYPPPGSPAYGPTIGWPTPYLSPTGPAGPPPTGLPPGAVPPPVPPPGPGTGTGRVVGVVLGLVALLVLVGGGGWYLLRPRAATVAAVAAGVTSTAPAPTTTDPGTAAADPPATGTSAGGTPGAGGIPGAGSRPTVVKALKVGDCVQTLRGDKISTVPVVDCTVPHELQLAGLYTPRKSAYPGHTALVRTGAAGCSPIVRAAVRADAPPTATVPLIPSEATWKAGDRRILCFVSGADSSTVSGSVLDDSTT